MNEKLPAHRGCTYIMPDSKKWQMRRQVKEIYADVPWMLERTHGCWCSSWKQTDDGWLIWRDEQWQKPHQGEFYMAINRMKSDDLDA